MYTNLQVTIELLSVITSLSNMYAMCYHVLLIDLNIFVNIKLRKIQMTKIDKHLVLISTVMDQMASKLTMMQKLENTIYSFVQ